MPVFKTIWLMIRAAYVARMTPREVARMVALVTLARLAWSDGSQAYRLHVGAARGVFRRSFKARAA